MDFQSLPAAWQYVILAMGAAIGTFVVLWCHNRIETRRRKARELATGLRELGLSRLADILDAYVIADYSAMVHDCVALAKEMKTPAGQLALLESAVTKVIGHYAASNATKAKEILETLKNGAASKSIFSSP